MKITVAPSEYKTTSTLSMTHIDGVDITAKAGDEDRFAICGIVANKLGLSMTGSTTLVCVQEPIAGREDSLCMLQFYNTDDEEELDDPDPRPSWNCDEDRFLCVNLIADGWQDWFDLFSMVNELILEHFDTTKPLFIYRETT